MFSLHACLNLCTLNSYRIFHYSFVIKLFYSLAFRIFVLALINNMFTFTFDNVAIFGARIHKLTVA